MLNWETLQVKATLKLIDLYGMEYMKQKIRTSWVARCQMEKFMRFYFCFENEDERPDLTPNYKGWTVWATLDVDCETGDVKVIECILPNGERVDG